MTDLQYNSPETGTEQVGKFDAIVVGCVVDLNGEAERIPQPVQRVYPREPGADDVGGTWYWNRYPG